MKPQDYVRPVRQCAGALVIRGAEVLLARRSSHRRLYPNVWDIPGGHRALNENIKATLVRELKEELDITAREYRAVAVLGELQPGQHGEAEYHVFIVTAWDGGEPRLLGSEHSELRWFTCDEALALSLAHPGYRGLLRAALPGTE